MGKGSKSRITNINSFRSNYDGISWLNKKICNCIEKTIKQPKINQKDKCNG